MQASDHSATAHDHLCPHFLGHEELPQAFVGMKIYFWNLLFLFHNKILLVNRYLYMMLLIFLKFFKLSLSLSIFIKMLYFEIIYIINLLFVN